MDRAEVVRSYFGAVEREMRAIDVGSVERLIGLFERVRSAAGTVHVAGDGGSAALAAHMECDFLKLAERGVGPAVRSLLGGAPLLTMIGNDAGFEEIFRRQLEAYARSGDAVILISGSGRSPNLLALADAAKRLGLETFGLLGFGSGGPLRERLDDAVVVESSEYRVIEDVHHAIGHSIVTGLSAVNRRFDAKIVVLDRDGVIGRAAPRGEYVMSAQSFEWMPGARDAIAALKRAGWTVVVATNQRGIALGRMTSADVDGIHRRISAELEPLGAAIDRFYVCPHDDSERCGCRKPGPGMLQAAARDFGYQLDHLVLIGDTEVEAVMGQRAGCYTIIVGETRGAGDEWHADLSAAVASLLRNSS